MPSSVTGFGFGPFGQHPFGASDWAEQALWHSIPQFYRDDDAIKKGLVANPLRGWIDSIKPSFSALRFKWEDFTDLWDPDEAPLDQLRLLGYTLGLEVLSTQPEKLQRSSVLNAVQLYLHKGTDKGYRTVAAFEGLTVTITPLWANSCDPGAELTPDGPSAYVALFDEVPADEIHLDTFYTDRFALWPYDLTPVTVPASFFFDTTPIDALPFDIGNIVGEGPCRSYSLRLLFAKPDDTEIEDFNDVSDRIVKLLLVMTPIHVTLDKTEFDGPKAAGSWVASVVSENSAAGSWVASVATGYGAVGSWTTSINADTVS